jgi:hypothetical protein
MEFRPNSLTLFLLETIERLEDRFLRDEILEFMPLHPNQHAYQAGKSVETALHQLMVRAEKALDQKETALGVFLDIQEALHTPPLSPCVLRLLTVRSIIPSYGGLELPWRVGWLQRLLVDLPGALRCLEAVHREMPCHHSYGALLLTN